MPVFKNAYVTTMGSFLPTSDKEKAVKESMIRSPSLWSAVYLHDVPLALRPIEGVKPEVIGVRISSEDQIPPFHHPLYVEVNDTRKFMVSDLRQYETLGSDGGVKLRNQIDYKSQLNRLIFSTLWLSDLRKDLKSPLEFAGTVFAYWISDVVSKRFALDPKDQLMLTVVLHAYYQSLFIEETSFDDDIKLTMSIHTIKNINAPGEFVSDVFSHIPGFKNVDDLCEVIKKVLSNIRLETFSTPLLVNLIQTSWFGTYAKESLSIALEYPPFWLSIVYDAINERTFKNSHIARIAERYGKNRRGEEYVKTFNSVLRTYAYKEGT